MLDVQYNRMVQKKRTTLYFYHSITQYVNSLKELALAGAVVAAPAVGPAEMKVTT